MFLVTVYCRERCLMSAVTSLMYHWRTAGGWDSGSRQWATSLSPTKYLELTPDMKGAACGRSEMVSQCWQAVSAVWQLALLPTTCSSVTLSSVWNLGGPPLTSHLYLPLVERLMLLRMMWVGLLRSSTVRPDRRKRV